jgi:hypothetical protein
LLTHCRAVTIAYDGVSMRNAMVLCLAVFLAASFASCGGTESDVPLRDRLTASSGNASPAATPSPASTAPAESPAGAPPEGVPTPAPTPDAATTLQLRSLARLILVPADLPPGYTVRNSQVASKEQIVEAQIAIPELALHVRESDLLGAWAALMTAPGPPETGVSSINYLFTTPEDAREFVEANGQILAADYLSATLAEPLGAESIGDASALMHFTTLDGESFEYTWSQGPIAGQVIVRYAGEAPPDAVAFTTALAAIQAQRVATFIP